MSGLLAMSGALSYAELGTMIPLSGAEYVYIRKGLGPFPAYLFSWTGILISRPGSIAIIITTCGNYIRNLIAPGMNNNWVGKVIALFLLWTLTAGNVASTNISRYFQNLTTVLKIGALITIGFMSFIIYVNGGGMQENLSGPIFSGSSLNPGNYALAAFSSLWAYDGWNNLNVLAEEVKDPSRVIPFSISVGAICVTIFYVIVNLSYFALLPLDVIMDSDAVALQFGNAALGHLGTILISVIVIISTIGATNASILSGSRISYVASKNLHASSFLSVVDTASGTPSMLNLTRECSVFTNNHKFSALDLG